jgi:hypothetical protein
VDSDADGISDWHEQVFFGSLGAGPNGDGDLDGLTYAEEVKRGQSPRAVDTMVAGGFSIRRGTAITVDPNLDPTPPEIGSVFATDVSADSALLTALVNSLSIATTASFDYGTTPALGNTVNSTTILNGFATEPMVARVSGLQPDTVYYFRVNAESSEGVSTSELSTFRTLADITGYEAWRRTFGVGSPSQDFDLDGISNLLEFATASHPRLSNVPNFTSGKDADQFHFEFTENREALADGVVFTVEWSNDLESGQWFSTGVVWSVLSDDGVTRRIRASVNTLGRDEVFMRLVVEQP